MSEKPKAFSYDFLSDDIADPSDEGIFFNRKDPPGSYGDPDAITDLSENRQVATIQMTLGPDGIPALFPGPASLDISGKVSKDELVCLHGPCDHYVERAVATGQKPDGTAALSIERYCTRLCTWAEPMKLDDADILACSSHSLGRQFTENMAEIDRVNTAAMSSSGHDLGICYHGLCRHNTVIVRRAVEADGEQHTRIKRFCTKLAGAARLKEILSYEPVAACNGLDSEQPNSFQRLDAMRHNLQVLATVRSRFEQRKSEE